MPIGRRRITTSLAICSLLSAASCIYSGGSTAIAEQISTQSNQQSPMLQGQAAAFGVLSDEIQFKMGFRCGTTENEDVVISDVRPETAASASSLKKGDHIVDAQMIGAALEIFIERDNKFFKARLRAIAKQAVLVAQQPMLDKTVRKPFTLNAEQTVAHDNQLIPENAAMAKQSPKIATIDSKRFSLQADKNAKLIADYKLELIVDRSNSMHQTDCPDGLSRWEWCGQQAGQLSKSLAPYTPNGLTIIPFASEYDVFEHATPQNIQTMFNSINLQQGTRLYEPLTERLDDYFAHRSANSKPLLIVIITDGVPSPRFEPALVKKTLIEATQKMKSPNEVVVVFCQIGGQDRFGQRYLSDLDQNLQSDGARYRFVHVISFDDLQSVGLGPALAAELKQYSPIKTAVDAQASAIASSISKPKPKTKTQPLIAKVQSVTSAVKAGATKSRGY